MATIILRDETETLDGVTRRTVQAIGRDPVTVIVRTGGAFDSVAVYLDNASSLAHRGPGRTFYSREDALRHYKSTAMKELLNYCFAG